MTDYENLENIEACGECGTFHDARYCPMLEALYDDEAPFCELHPDTIPTQVRGVEGDDIGYECPDCVKDMGEHNKALADEVSLTCIYHPDTLYQDIRGRRGHDGWVIKECPKCLDEVKKRGGGLGLSEQSDMYDDYLCGL